MTTTTETTLPALIARAHYATDFRDGGAGFMEEAEGIRAVRMEQIAHMMAAWDKKDPSSQSAKGSAVRAAVASIMAETDPGFWLAQLHVPMQRMVADRMAPGSITTVPVKRAAPCCRCGTTDPIRFTAGQRPGAPCDDCAA